MRLGRIVPYLAFLVIVAALPLRPAAAQSDARAFMTDVGNRVVKLVSDRQASETDRKQQFTKLVDGAFDVPKIARFVLGRYWRTATDQERQQFQAAFETYMISVYWSHFTSYNGETFTVSGSQPGSNGAVTVTTEVMRPATGQQPVRVDWYLMPSGNSYKIEDASLEGVSQLVTYRDEFSSIIEQNGGKVSALIDKLNERNKG